MNDVQKCILSIFKEVAKVCEENNIPYYAIGGTCIGAIRHNGFIPWDDDLDIAIPIEFYDRFLDLAKNNLPKEYYVITPSDNHHYHTLWAKVCDNRTTFIEESEFDYLDSYKGVFVDIMPISGVPSSRLLRLFFRHWLLFLDRSNRILRFGNSSNKKIRYTKYLPYTLLSHFVPFHFFSDLFYKELKKHLFYESKMTGYVWYTCWLKRLVFPSDWFRKGVLVQFEDTTINCPSEYKKYLQFQFGDYMTLPPIDKRQIHSGIVDLTIPYYKYTKKDVAL